MRGGTYVESEPRPGGTQQNLSVLPLTEVPAEVGPAGLGNIDLGGDDAVIGTTLDTLKGVIDIPYGLFHVTLDIEGETRGFGDGKTEVKSNNTGDTSKTDEETPAVVNAGGCGGGLRKDGALVCGNHDKGNKGGSCTGPRSNSWRP